MLDEKACYLTCSATQYEGRQSYGHYSVPSFVISPLDGEKWDILSHQCVALTGKKHILKISMVADLLVNKNSRVESLLLRVSTERGIRSLIVAYCLEPLVPSPDVMEKFACYFNRDVSSKPTFSTRL